MYIKQKLTHWRLQYRIGIVFWRTIAICIPDTRSCMHMILALLVQALGCTSQLAPLSGNEIHLKDDVLHAKTIWFGV